MRCEKIDFKLIEYLFQYKSGYILVYVWQDASVINISAWLILNSFSSIRNGLDNFLSELKISVIILYITENFLIYFIRNIMHLINQ